MDWFMLPFVLSIAGMVIYYITRQANDPGEYVFPLNSAGEFIDESLEAAE